MDRHRNRVRSQCLRRGAGVVVALCLTGLIWNAAAEPIGPVKVDPGIPPYTGPAELTGSLVIAGSDTMQPLMSKLASTFQQLHRGVRLGVEGGGSEKSVMKFISDQSGIRRGDADVGAHQVSGSVGLLASSRSLTREEIADFHARYGFDPTPVPIAMDAVALYVNRVNPIQGLTLEQVDAIFGTDHKRGLQEDLATWGQLGLTGEWAQQPIHLYGRDRESGTRTFFVHTALLDGNLKGNITEAPGSATQILNISRDPLAIGYAGIGFQTTMVRAIPLAEKAGMPFVVPSAETTAQGTYPLGRPLYLYVKKRPNEELESVILEFLRFVNSRQGQMVVAKSGTYSLPATQVAENLKAVTGTGLASAAALAARSR